jgi:O-antigen ligase
MSDTAAFGDGVLVAGMVLAAALAAGAVLARTMRGRAWAMLGALVLTPVLLVAEIWNSPQMESVRDRGPLALGAAGVGLAAMGALAFLFARRPAVLGVAALAALPFRVPVQSGGSTANLLVPLYVVIGAGAVAWLVPRLAARHAGVKPAERSGALEWVLLGAIVLYALQAVYAGDSAKALEQVVFFYVPFALLFTLLRGLPWTPRQLVWGGGALVFLALVFTAIGFWEFQTRSLLLNPKVIASNQVEEYFRVNSLFFDPNIYGRFLALVMLGLASVLLWAKRARSLAWTIAGLVVLWGGLITTLSQSSFAALLLGLTVLAWLRWGGKVVIFPALAAVVVAAVIVFAFGSSLRIDLGDSKSLDNATSGRFDLMRGGIDLARDKPLLGWGSGSFNAEYRRHEHSSSREATSASHTIPITVAAEQGIIGLAAYVALLALAFIRLLRGARGSPARAAIAAGFAALVLHTWLYAAFLEDPVTWTLLALGTALAVPAAARVAEDEEDAAAALNGHRRERVVVAPTAPS